MDKLNAKTFRYNAGLLAAERRRLGISQEEIADRIGFSRQQVNRAEKQVSASFVLVQRLCKELGVPISDVIPDLAIPA